LSPMSAMYKQAPVPQRPAEISSQSRVTTGTRTRPRGAPVTSTANRSVLCPESLWVQTTPGVRRLIARPLASGISGRSVLCATVHGPAASPGRNRTTPTSAPATPKTH